MKQDSLGFGDAGKRTRKREFLDEMERVVPWSALVELVAPYAPEGRRGRPPFSVETAEIARLCGGRFTLRELERVDVLAANPKFAELGIPEIVEPDLLDGPAAGGEGDVQEER